MDNKQREFYLQYKEILMGKLNMMRKDNGVFRAALSTHYDACWIRDNYWCNMSYLEEYPELYLQTCHTHLDFLHMYENDYDHKLSWLLKDPDVGHWNNYRYIHPKVNFDGTEIEGMAWNTLQLDSFPAYYLLMIYQGWKKGLSVFRNDEDKKVVQLCVKILEKLDISNRELCHSWEEINRVFTSNLGLCIKVLEGCYEMGFDVDREELKKIRSKFNDQFPFECKDRDWDFTLLFICVLDDFLSPIQIEDIVQGVTVNLEREHGVIRYINDVYKPFNDGIECREEMQWKMAFGYLSIIYSKMGMTDVAKQYLDKIVMDYPDGDIPEGVNELNQDCYNKNLAWSISMTIQAINKLLDL